MAGRVLRRKGADRSEPEAVKRAEAVAKGSGLETRVSPGGRASDDQGCDDREAAAAGRTDVLCSQVGAGCEAGDGSFKWLSGGSGAISCAVETQLSDGSSLFNSDGFGCRDVKKSAAFCA